MSTQEVVRDHPSAPLAPIDESVVIPQSVRQAAEKANSFYQQSHVEKAPETGGNSTQEVAPPVQEQPEPIQAPLENIEILSKPPVPSKQEIQQDNWANRYNAMKGRYDASQRTISDLQGQLSQMGEELEKVLQQRPAQQPPQTQRLLTPEDEQTYGAELIDFAKRAAQEAVAPHLAQLQQENEQLKRRTQNNVRMSVKQVLSQEVPDWEAINFDPEFKQWLRLRDVYSGGVRQSLLNAAYQAADAPRVVAFFKGFLQEKSATGNPDPEPQAPQAQPAPPVVKPAVPLMELASPGRGRASGDQPQIPEKPIFTRKQVSEFYDRSRRGYYNGRETERAKDEQAIFAAQREGRIR